MPPERTPEDDEDPCSSSHVDPLVQDDARSLAEVRDSEPMFARLHNGAPFAQPVAGDPGNKVTVELYIGSARGSWAEPPAWPPTPNTDIPVPPRPQHARLLAQ